ncbi:hypothetical protein [Chamaesiphon sp. VAR_48_metabat_403]|nr:hypothetical protein [Chamaesiphon sp. VAR_48_metabat_403]
MLCISSETGIKLTQIGTKIGTIDRPDCDRQGDRAGFEWFT